MKPVFTLALLAILALPAYAQQQTERPPLTPEEQARKDEFLRKNPQMREQVEANEKRGLRVKETETRHIQLDAITGKPIPLPLTAETAEPKKEEPKFIGNPNVADEAYRKKDYRTALENYRALAREGDPKATLMVGIMQQEGQGMKKDKAAAYAWYGRAAELGDGTASQIVRGMNDNDELSRKEQEAAAKQYEELSKEFDDPEVAKNADERFGSVQSQTQVNEPEYGRTAPKSISGGDSRSTKRPRTYNRDPAPTGETDDFKAGTYNQPTDD